MNGKYSVLVLSWAALVAANAPAQDEAAGAGKAARNAGLRDEVVEVAPVSWDAEAEGEVAAVLGPVFSYQGFIEDANGPMDNKSLLVRFSAWDAPQNGTRLGQYVTATLSASEVNKGVITVKNLSAAALGIPPSGQETFLAIEVCTPPPSCTLVPLAPRTAIDNAIYSIASQSLLDSAYAQADGSLLVQSSANPSGSGVLNLRSAAGVGIQQALQIDATAAVLSASSADGASKSMHLRSMGQGSYMEMEVSDLTGEMKLNRATGANTATTVLCTTHFFTGSTGTIFRANPCTGPLSEANTASPLDGSLRLESMAADGAMTVITVDQASKAITLSQENSVDTTAGPLTPPPSLKFDFNAAGTVTLSALSGTNAAAMSLNSGNNNFLSYDPAVGEATVAKPMRVQRMLLDPSAGTASNVAAPTPPLFATLEYVPPTANATAGTTDAAELQLKVNDGTQDHIVARWTGRPGYPPAEQFVNAPNYIGGSPANYIDAAGSSYGATIVNGGGNDGLQNRPSHPLLSPGPNYCPAPDTPCWDAANRVLSNHGAIVAGYGNEVRQNCFIGAGRQNQAGTSASDADAVVVGGRYNTATGSLGAIVGGSGNVAGAGAFVGGGAQNAAGANFAVVAGGFNNLATGTGAGASTVGGGEGNSALKTYATVSGGLANVAAAQDSMVPGGEDCKAGGDGSFAAGRRAKVRDELDVDGPGGDPDGDQGTFAWADWTNADFTSDGPNKFLVRASGGTAFYSSGDLSTGVTLAAGGGSWSSVSDRNLKENFAEIDKTALLEKLSAIPVTTWNYKAQDASIRHIGPMGQDFAAAFGVGEQDTKITTIDADGVALAAIQGLHELVKEKDCEIEGLGSEISNLKSEISELKAIVVALTRQNGGSR